MTKNIYLKKSYKVLSDCACEETVFVLKKNKKKRKKNVEPKVKFN